MVQRFNFNSDKQRADDGAFVEYSEYEKLQKLLSTKIEAMNYPQYVIITADLKKHDVYELMNSAMKAFLGHKTSNPPKPTMIMIVDLDVTVKNHMDTVTRIKHLEDTLRQIADGKENASHLAASALKVPVQILAHGHRQDWYLMANARSLQASKYRRVPNWAFASDLFATGSNSAWQICKEAGIDPDGFKVERSTQPQYIPPTTTQGKS